MPAYPWTVRRGLETSRGQIFIDPPSVSDADQILDTGAGRFEPEQRGEETIVRIVRGAPAGECNAINEGWLTFVHQLRFASSTSSASPSTTGARAC